MLNPNHPDEERLSALAARDDDAVADGPLTSHVDTCDRCAALVSELGALRVSLSQLPDIVPPRPLRLVPPVDEPRAGIVERLGGWARRFFAPVATAGAALALVGLIGTAAPVMEDAADFADAGSEAGAQPDALEPIDGAADAGTYAEEGDGAEPGVMSATDEPRGGVDELRLGSGDAAEEAGAGQDAAAERDDAAAQSELPAERSPWPMVLFTGVAIVVAALLLRWILVPARG